jgi:branched-chain amino acid transport system substrate-binding protein
MTGAYAAFGSQMKVGAQKAVADINAAGGLLGRRLRLEVGDDACDAKQATGVARQFASQGVVFVAGHFCSSSSIPASHIYAEHGIPQISPASTNPRFTDERAGPNVFRLAGRDDRQGLVAGKYIAEKFKDKVVAVLHDKTAYGKGLADDTKKSMNAAGKKEALYEAITAGEKDYTAVVSKLKQANVDLVYVGGYHSEVGLIVRQMRAQGMKAILMGGDALVTNEYWQITGKDGEGTLMTFTPDPRQGLAATNLVKEFRASGIEPEGFRALHLRGGPDLEARGGARRFGRREEGR